MRLRVDYDRCQGHTLCAWAAPAVIRLADEDGRAVVDDPVVPADQHEAVRRAVANCPENALIIDEISQFADVSRTDRLPTFPRSWSLLLLDIENAQ